MYVSRVFGALATCTMLLVCSCSDSKSDCSRDLEGICDLGHQTRESLLSSVSNLVNKISRESSSSRREALFDMLISRIVEVGFAPPSRSNTPADSMINYAEFLQGAAKILDGHATPEKTLDMLLLGLRRFDMEIAHVDEWTHQCFPDATDWGFPPETDEILACLKAGDTNGVHASSRARTALLGMTPDLRRRFPKIVERVLTSKSGGSRAINFKTGMESRKLDLLQVISSKFMYTWSLKLESAAYEVLRERFREGTGCDLPANGGRNSFISIKPTSR